MKPISTNENKRKNLALGIDDVRYTMTSEAYLVRYVGN